MPQKKKETLGLREKVAIRPVSGGKWQMFTAKLDTGAAWSRIGARKAAKLKLGPIVDVKSIGTSDGGSQLRLVVPASLRIASRQIAVNFTISMTKPGVLIGRRTMGNRFSIDPKKRYLAMPPSLR